MNSVWPTNAGSVSCVASLFIGIVTMPATSPASAASVAGSDVGPGRRARRGVELARTVVGGGEQAGVDDAQRAGVRVAPATSIDVASHVETEQLAAVGEDRGVAVDDGVPSTSAPSAARRSTISGPTPEASPIVIAIGAGS